MDIKREKILPTLLTALFLFCSAATAQDTRAGATEIPVKGICIIDGEKTFIR